MTLKLFLVLGLLGGVLSLQSIKDTPRTKSLRYSISSSISNLQSLAQAVGLPSYFSLQVTHEREMQDGNVKARLQLTYNGLPVRNYALRATRNSNGNFVGEVRGYYPTISPALDTSASVNDQQLKKATAQYVKDRTIRQDVGEIKANDIDDFTTQKQIYINPSTGAASVVYFCKGFITIPTFFRNPKVLYNIASGQIISGSILVRFASSESDESGEVNKRNSCPNVQGGNEKLGVFNYGSGSNEICLDVQRDGDKCILAGDNFVVLSLDNSYDKKKAKTVSFKCNKGPNDSINGAKSPSVDAFYAAQSVFRLLNSYKANPLVNREPLSIYVHYGENFDNSFCNGKDVFMGDGSELLFPAPSGPDVVAHEIGHAFSAAYGKLQLGPESHTVDEAFADITALVLMRSIGLASENDWLIGATITKQAGESLRDLQNPSNDDFYIDNTKYLGAITAPGQASGIISKAFYNALQPVVSAGQTKKIAYRDLYESFLQANIIEWNEDSFLADAAVGVVNAAGDLGLDTGIIIAAFEAVGVNVRDFL
ncbi:hemagglutinin/proteinase [Biomphalaria pfeifferi]|uniref:Hemagglutinin/proteinase n=1 Tax=Biomphalaria pfeifferi TaxID=112525 RepID=A0AAD8CB67_BIOPF|nr:hemagglutinin/proteinase [Biomphalaria pfeifferi]